MRSIKDAGEVEEIEKAVDVAYDMHIAAMKMCKQGTSEQNIFGVVEGMAWSKGNEGPFPFDQAIPSTTPKIFCSEVPCLHIFIAVTMHIVCNINSLFNLFHFTGIFNRTHCHYIFIRSVDARVFIRQGFSLEVNPTSFLFPHGMEEENEFYGL